MVLLDIIVVFVSGFVGFLVATQYIQTDHLVALRREVKDLGDTLIVYRNALSETLIRLRKVRQGLRYVAKQHADLFGQIVVVEEFEEEESSVNSDCEFIEGIDEGLAFAEKEQAVTVEDEPHLFPSPDETVSTTISPPLMLLPPSTLDISMPSILDLKGGSVYQLPPAEATFGELDTRVMSDA